jgi:hypothetical protein
MIFLMTMPPIARLCGVSFLYEVAGLLLIILITPVDRKNTIGTIKSSINMLTKRGVFDVNKSKEYSNAQVIYSYLNRPSQAN